MRYSAKRRVGALSLFRVSAALDAAVSSLAPAPLKSRSAFGMGPWKVERLRFGRQGGEQSCLRERIRRVDGVVDGVVA